MSHHNEHHKDENNHLPIVKRFEKHRPLVGFETTVLSHGLPFPSNWDLVKMIQDNAKKEDIDAVFLGIVNGKIVGGMSEQELDFFCKEKTVKVGEREIEISMAKKENAATTVSATIFLADLLGIEVCSTGGLGGVHPGLPKIDISADLPALSRHNTILVCSGAKSILDLPATIELLETLGVTLVGYKTNSFPTFYVKGGIGSIPQVDSIEEIAETWKMHKALNRKGTLLVLNPCPEDLTFTKEEFEGYWIKAEEEGKKAKIAQKNVTPFLLSKVNELSNGKALKANLALLESNFVLAAKISKYLNNR